MGYAVHFMQFMLLLSELRINKRFFSPSHSFLVVVLVLNECDDSHFFRYKSCCVYLTLIFSHLINSFSRSEKHFTINFLPWADVSSMEA